MQDAAIPGNRHHKAEGRWQLYLVVLIPSLALGLAWYLYFFGTGFLPDGRTNKGELILPPASFESLLLTQDGTAFGSDQLKGKWGVIIFGEAACSSEVCQESLYQTRQAHIALGREADRVVRIYVSTSELPSTYIQDEHREVFWLKAKSPSVIQALSETEWPTNRYYIVDPLGNIMMKYKAGQYGRDLLKDLQKLLKASAIG